MVGTNEVLILLLECWVPPPTWPGTDPTTNIPSKGDVGVVGCQGCQRTQHVGLCWVCWVCWCVPSKEDRGPLAVCRQRGKKYRSDTYVSGDGQRMLGRERGPIPWIA